MDEPIIHDSSCDVDMVDYEKKPQVAEINDLLPPSKELKSEDLYEEKKPETPSGNKCPICLTAGMTDPTVLDACQHHFCFECICEWIKMKPECPLCKRNLRFLKHNLIVQEGENLTWETEGKIESVAEFRSNFELDYIHRTANYSPEYERNLVAELVQALQNRIRETRQYFDHGILTTSEYRSRINNLRKELEHHENLLNMLDENHPQRGKIFNDPTFRRLIYLKNLTPRVIVAPRFPIFLNEAYVRSQEESVRERLIPFIIRDLTALIESEAVEVDSCIKMIFRFLKSEIKRTEVVTFLRKRGVPHPHQFLNNLQHFAETGHYLHVYDENTEYVPRIMNHIIGGDDEDIQVLNSHDDQVQVIHESRPRRHPLVQSNNAGYNFHHRLQNEMQNRLRRSRRLNNIFNNPVHYIRSGNGPHEQEPVIVESSDSDSSEDEPQVIETTRSSRSPGTSAFSSLRPINSAPNIEAMQPRSSSNTGRRVSSFPTYESPFGYTGSLPWRPRAPNWLNLPTLQDLFGRFRGQSNRSERNDEQSPVAATPNEPRSEFSDDEEIYAHPACKLPRVDHVTQSDIANDVDSFAQLHRNHAGPSWLTSVLPSGTRNQASSRREPSIVELEADDDDGEDIEVLEEGRGEDASETNRVDSRKSKEKKRSKKRSHRARD